MAGKEKLGKGFPEEDPASNKDTFHE